MSDEELPNLARAMIIGVGVIGRPVGCHLTRPGRRDVVPGHDTTSARVRV